MDARRFRWRSNTNIGDGPCKQELAYSAISGKCETIQGVVTGFVPQAEGDHEPETFMINSRQFSYSYASATAGFNQTQSHNGPIQAGQRLRIEIVGSEIARIEVAD